MTEQPSGAVTTYGYDAAGRLLSEVRAGDRPYSGTYQYDATGRRTYAKRVENGVTSHEGAYSYDAAGRLAQVVDAATSATEAYTWYADGTLASYPGPGYTRKLDYDPEQRLTSISHDYGGGNVQTAYEYGYGADGGRRWSKDYAAGVQTWYPCGVACGAGELVEQQAPLAGGNWTTSAQYLQGTNIVSRNGEYHHFDPLGNAGVITDSNGAVVSNNLYDASGALRYSQGNAQTPYRQEEQRGGAEGLNTNSMGGSVTLPNRDVQLIAPTAEKKRERLAGEARPFKTKSSDPCGCMAAQEKRNRVCLDSLRKCLKKGIETRKDCELEFKICSLDSYSKALECTIRCLK